MGNGEEASKGDEKPVTYRGIQRAGPKGRGRTDFRLLGVPPSVPCCCVGTVGTAGKSVQNYLYPLQDSVAVPGGTTV